MARIGKVTTIAGESVIEWKIMNFFALSTRPNKVYSSPYFSFANENWYFGIYPNGKSTAADSVGFIALYLYRESDGPAIELEYSFSLKTQNGRIDKKIQMTDTAIFKPKNKILGWGFRRFLNRSELLERKHELAPFNNLSVVCIIKQTKLTKVTSFSGGVTSKCIYCQIALEADVNAHQEKCLNKPIKCPQCSDVIPLKNWYEHKCQETEAKVSEKLLNDLKEMMLSGEHSDTVIKVKGEEFRLQKIILSVRNPFFQAMYKNDMKENITGVVTIDDCEPDVFRTFIHFVYTGKVDKISPENVCDLYEVAVKYQEDQLKEQCLGFMVNNISVENVCDFILLALRHDIKKLLQDSTGYFCSKTKEIVRSVKWQTFLEQYPTQANELYIKALDKSDDK